jgi:hypothetical protein
LSIVIVFVAKNNRLRDRKRKKTTKNSKKAKKWKKKSAKKESAEETKELAGKSIMIRLYPNKSQKEELNKWFGTARWTYNQVVASLHASPQDVSQYAVVKELRKDFVNNKNSNHEENFADKPWVTKTPYYVRDAALNDVVKAYTSNLAKKDNNNFIIHFKKKKAPSDSIAIYAKNYKSKGVIFPKVFGKETIKSAEELPDKLKYDARLAKITTLSSYPNLRPRKWFLEVAEKSTQRLLERCLLGVTTDSGHN